MQSALTVSYYSESTNADCIDGFVLLRRNQCRVHRWFRTTPKVLMQSASMVSYYSESTNAECIDGFVLLRKYQCRVHRWFRTTLKVPMQTASMVSYYSESTNAECIGCFVLLRKYQCRNGEPKPLCHSPRGRWSRRWNSHDRGNMLHRKQYSHLISFSIGLLFHSHHEDCISLSNHLWFPPLLGGL